MRLFGGKEYVAGANRDPHPRSRLRAAERHFQLSRAAVQLTNHRALGLADRRHCCVENIFEADHLRDRFMAWCSEYFLRCPLLKKASWLEHYYIFADCKRFFERMRYVK